MSLRIGTYNIGSGWADYTCMVYASHEGQQQLQARVQNTYPPNIWALMHQPERSKEERDTIRVAEEVVKRTLIGVVEQNVALRLANALDVICLQGVGDMNRRFVETLCQTGFTIYPGKELSAGNKDTFSTAIALRNDRFSSVRNISIVTPGQGKALCGQEIAAIVGTLMDSSVTIAVTSLHSWSFKLYNPQSGAPRFYSQEDRQMQQASEAYLAQALNLLQRQNADFSLMAGDLNNNPENYSPAFELIRSRGYEVLTPFASTHITRFEEGYPLRIVDFIFPKEKKTCLESFCETLSSPRKTSLKIVWTPAHVLEGFDFTIDGNCSDHKPVGTTLSVIR